MIANGFIQYLNPKYCRPPDPSAFESVKLAALVRDNSECRSMPPNQRFEFVLKSDLPAGGFE